MKKSIYSFLFAALFCLTVSPVAAQYSKTSYFMESASYRHFMNPAQTPYRGYISFPIVSNYTMGFESNLGASNFLFPSETSDELLTFMHPDVSADRFLDGLSDNNMFNMNLRTDLLGFGFYAGRSFVSFDVALRTQGGVNMPKEFFAFLKKGMSNSQLTEYDIRNFTLSANAFAEASLGFATDVFDNIRVGARVKFLAGIGGISAGIDQMDIRMTQDEWRVNTQATMAVYGGMLDIQENEEGYVDLQNITASTSEAGLGGKGIGLDFGVTYKPFKFLTVSAAVNDLGAIRWDQTAATFARSKGEVVFSGLNGLSTSSFGGSDDEDGEGGNALSDQISDITDELMELTQFQLVQDGDLSKTKLHTNIMLGLEASTWKDRLSAGLLYTNTRADYDNYSELMFIGNFRMIKQLQLSASYALLSDYCRSCGVALTLLNTFYFSVEHLMMNYSPQFIPLDPISTSFQLGVNIPLNRKKTRTPRTSLGFFEL